MESPPSLKAMAGGVRTAKPRGIGKPTAEEIKRKMENGKLESPPSLKAMAGGVRTAKPRGIGKSTAEEIKMENGKLESPPSLKAMAGGVRTANPGGIGKPTAEENKLEGWKIGKPLMNVKISTRRTANKTSLESLSAKICVNPWTNRNQSNLQHWSHTYLWMAAN
ncbi:MAG: hypothetical protein IPL46_15490 [Saprospiraceae bacterium]|nr:hypothetical protein [Saprospiraceae bacterium]